MLVPCQDDRECAAGQLCATDPARGTLAVPLCRPRCASDAECPVSTFCVHARAADGGFEDACSVACDVVTNEGCPLGTTCSLDYFGSDAGDIEIPLCRHPSSVAEGCPCVGISSGCAANLTCRFDTPTEMCARMCVIGTNCADGTACMLGRPTWSSHGVSYGFCAAPGC